MAGSGDSGAGAGASVKSGVIAESPMIGEGCFDASERPYIIRAGVPLTAEMLVAAVYGEDSLFDFDIADDEGLWEIIAFVVVREGLYRIEERALKIREEQGSGTLAAPEWLDLCRRRVAELIDPAWQAAAHRCPCGYAAVEASAFGEHMSMAQGTRPEHFGVTTPEAIYRFWEREPLMPRAVSLDDSMTRR